MSVNRTGNYSNKKMKISNIVLYISYFLLGFGEWEYYFIFFVLAVLLNKKSFFNKGLAKSYWLVSIMYLVVILFVYYVGKERLSIDGVNNLMLVHFFIVIVCGWLMFIVDGEIKRILIGLYISGALVKSLLIVVYNIFYLSDYSGYGKIYDPFIGADFNSPIYLAMISIGFTYYFTNTVREKKQKRVLLGFMILLLCIVSAIYLGGRSFFINAFVVLVMVFWLFKDNRPSIIISIFVLSGFMLYVLSDSLFTEKLNFLFYRLEVEGVDSPRWHLYGEGIKNILTNPFGWNVVYAPSLNYYTLWYHNVFFDIARVGGWIPLIAYIVIIYWVGLHLRKSYDKKYNLILFVSILMISMQDVVFEGSYQLFILLYFVAIDVGDNDYALVS
jgi:hypothetical protein